MNRAPSRAQGSRRQGIGLVKRRDAWRDGTTRVVFTPHELIEKLIPLIPRPRAHLVRYHGILGLAARDCAKVVPRLVRSARGRPAASGEPRELDPSGLPRLGRLPWAVLLKATRPPPQLDLLEGREPSDSFYPDPPSPDW